MQFKPTLFKGQLHFVFSPVRVGKMSRKTKFQQEIHIWNSGEIKARATYVHFVNLV